MVSVAIQARGKWWDWIIWRALSRYSNYLELRIQRSTVRFKHVSLDKSFPNDPNMNPISEERVTDLGQLPHVLGGRTDAQRQEVTCSRSHRK